MVRWVSSKIPVSQELVTISKTECDISLREFNTGTYIAALPEELDSRTCTSHSDKFCLINFVASLSRSFVIQSHLSSPSVEISSNDVPSSSAVVDMLKAINEDNGLLTRRRFRYNTDGHALDLPETRIAENSPGH